jgi:uncharacterized membrane protein YfcA
MDSMGLKIIPISLAVFSLGLIMSMLGRGGGNFYVPILVAAGFSMTVAAANAQLILMITSLLAAFVFHQHRMVDWKLALIIDPPTDIMAFFGGYFAHHFMGFYLKTLFSLLLVIAAYFMFKPIQEKRYSEQKRAGYWYRSFGEYHYRVNLWLTIPLTAAVGFFAGMIGISGGSFKIPLMVLLCGVPMRIAVGTSSAMVALTACMGFTGHALAGDFHSEWMLPLVFAAAAGGILGGKLSLKVNPNRLRKWFAYTTLAAAVFMGGNAFSQNN